MKYIDVKDIDDGLLEVNESDITEAESYIENVAQRKGVKVSEIIVPLTFRPRRLAICFACYNCCLRNVGKDPTTTFDSGSRDDIYAQKLSFYKKELKENEEIVTALDFSGVNLGGLNIGLERA